MSGDEATPGGLAFAVLAALRLRDRTGHGGLIEFAQAENVLHDVGEYFLTWQLTGFTPTILGNADRFDYDTTQIIYNGDQFAAGANKIREALGLGTVSQSPTPTDIEDVTVILGRDASAKFGGNGG